MTEKNKKPQKQWKSLDWSIGSERPIKKGKFKTPADSAGKKRYKGGPGQEVQPGADDTEAGDKRFQRANAGWLFYKQYYHGIPFRCGQDKEELKPFFEAKNRVITSRQLLQYREEVDILQGGCESLQRFEMTTVYPGLVTGLGAPHETHRLGEYKLGFHFDHTTGLPVIPGSTVKGMLRAAFKKNNDEESGYRYVQWLLNEISQESGTDVESYSIDQVKSIEREVFEGKGLSPYRRDVFLDAVILSSGNEKTLFLADDFITPHASEFKDPMPLQFLKVLPQVTFRFQFRLVPGQRIPITVKMKLDLFKRILEDLGIGAKTNVGYGKFRL
jgi:CRISPR-associated protein Cmr6